MNTLECIKYRRSIRKYTKYNIDSEAVNKILSSAMHAPSAGDGRPWQFVVFDEQCQLDLLAKHIDNDNEMFRGASIAILVCAEPKKEGFPGFYPQDLSCACQNIYLSTYELGLATVWIALWNVHPRIEGLKKIIDLPEDIVPFAIFPIGFPDEQLNYEERFNSDLIHFNKW